MDLVSEIIGEFIWGIVVVPLVLMFLATPVILTLGLFGKDTYFKNVRLYYKKIKDYFWKSKEKGEKKV